MPDFQAHLLNKPPTNAYPHESIPNVIYWAWNHNSGDTGGLVDRWRQGGGLSGGAGRLSGARRLNGAGQSGARLRRADAKGKYGRRKSQGWADDTVRCRLRAI